MMEVNQQIFEFNQHRFVPSTESISILNYTSELSMSTIEYTHRNSESGVISIVSNDYVVIVILLIQSESVKI